MGGSGWLLDGGLLGACRYRDAFLNVTMSTISSKQCRVNVGVSPNKGTRRDAPWITGFFPDQKLPWLLEH